MVLKFYALAHSPPCKVVAVVLHEKQIPFEFINVDLASGEHKKSEHLDKNPFGQIPCIDDNGFILYESRAICRYLEETYPNQGTKLIPSDPKKRAVMDQFIFTEVCNFHRLSLQIVSEIFYKKLKKSGNPDAEKVKEATDSLATKLDVYEQLLSRQKYIAGDEVTLVDLYHLPLGSLLARCGVNVIQERPNVAKWFNEISSRPSWQKVKNPDGLDND